MRTHLLISLTLLAPVLLAADDSDFHRSTIVAGIGAASPVGSSYLSTAPLIRVNYGYRFNKYFQADAGLQLAFGAANNVNAVQTDFGPVQGGDHEYMIPLGGRFFIPLPFRRIEASVGGGAVYLHYSETAPSNGIDVTNCYTCTSRGGWGGYGLGNVSYFLDSDHIFHVGTTLQFISASTNGQVVGSSPSAKTSDRWVNFYIEFGMSF